MKTLRKPTPEEHLADLRRAPAPKGAQKFRVGDTVVVAQCHPNVTPHRRGSFSGRRGTVIGCCPEPVFASGQRVSVRFGAANNNVGLDQDWLILQ